MIEFMAEPMNEKLFQDVFENPTNSKRIPV